LEKLDRKTNVYVAFKESTLILLTVDVLFFTITMWRYLKMRSFDETMTLGREYVIIFEGTIVRSQAELEAAEKRKADM
jgi:hypothetical protein